MLKIWRNRCALFGGFVGLASGILLTVCATLATSRAVSPDQIHETLKLVADWQLDHMATSPTATDPSAKSSTTGWVQASFYIGLARWAAQSDDPRYFEAVRKLGEQNRWRLGPRLDHADDHAIGQVYAAAFDRYGEGQIIAPMLADFDRIIDSKPDVPLVFDEAGLCQKRWCWCDALFMAPASWMAVSRITGDSRYRDYADAEYWAAKDYLFDDEEHLFFRDSRYFNERGPDGEKIFWGRGNGWVFAGLINILRELPHDYPRRARYEDLFKTMANKIVTRQRSDGFWATSLMRPPETGAAESSSTALFTYGFASGVNLGLLDHKRFAPAALRGWMALAGAVDRDGRVGRVQGIGDRPGPVHLSESEPYASGALLLAGTATKLMLDAQSNR
jgi:unsaturated rhamnogalacturonyl hydrolase